jgi:hypothetical protein
LQEVHVLRLWGVEQHGFGVGDVGEGQEVRVQVERGESSMQQRRGGWF